MVRAKKQEKKSAAQKDVEAKMQAVIPACPPVTPLIRAEVQTAHGQGVFNVPSTGLNDAHIR